MSPRLKKLIFRGTAILLPVLFLAGLELVLRLSGVAQPAPLFTSQEKDGAVYYNVNPDVARRYFGPSDPAIPRLYPQTFGAEKSRNTIRVVCLGGSTTAGFPYEHNATFPQQLRFLLQNAYPGYSFEVLNLGLSAVNSFTVRDWAAEIAEIARPDLVLIYMGHNEFYGAYGSASSIGGGGFPALVRLTLWLNRLHTLQLVKNLFSENGENSGDKKTLMERMIADAAIPYDSDLVHQTHDTFEENTRDILSAFKDTESRVIISTLVSNLLDQPPFDGRWRSHPDSASAQDLWLQGRALVQQAGNASARDFLSKAKDYDLLRFRAAGAVNAIIEELGAEMDVPVVDMPARFGEAAAADVAGDDLFCDHLHPNADGYHLMARAFFDGIVKQGWLGEARSLENNRSNPLYVTPIDREIGLLRVHRLKQRPPFRDAGLPPLAYTPYANSSTAAEARRFLFEHFNWVKSHYAMADHYKAHGDSVLACDEYEAVSRQYDKRPEPLNKWHNCLLKNEDWNGVLETSRRLLEVEAEKGRIYQDMAVAQWNSGQYIDAVNTIQKAIVAPEFDRKQRGYAKFMLARFLFGLRRTQDAQKVLNDALLDDPSLQKNLLIK